MNRIRNIVVLCARWVWTPMLVKMCLWLGAFAALTHVGQNAAVRALDAPRPIALDAAIGTVSSPASSASARASPCSASEGAITADGRVVLNRASLGDLQRLPGVGAKRAEAILEVRAKLGGRFRDLRDLLRVRGIGLRSLKRIEPLVVLDEPPSKPEGKPKPPSAPK
jgi:competence protein ComEA